MCINIFTTHNILKQKQKTEKVYKYLKKITNYKYISISQ